MAYNGRVGKNKLFLALGVLVCVDILVVLGILYLPKKSPASKSLNINIKASSSIPMPLILSSPKPTQTNWTLLLTGDIIPARVVNQKMVAKNDFLWPLTNIKETLKNADLTLINLEAPLIKNCPVTSEGMKFCGEADFAQSLFEAGVDVANLANNHSLNFGWEGILATEEKLHNLGIETTGFTAQNISTTSASNQINQISNNLTPTPLTQNNAIAQNCAKNSYCSKFVVKEIKKEPEKGDKTIKVGFLGYNGVGQTINRDIAREQIQSARSQVDVLVVSVHWGKEYVREPQSVAGLAPDDPKELGKLFIDWGADIVAGNHPHWYQGMEWFTSSASAFAKAMADKQGEEGKEKLIIYAQGNTVFDQEWSAETKVGYLLKLHIQDANIIKDQTEIIPIGIKEYGQAYLLDGVEKAKVLQDLKNL